MVVGIFRRRNRTGNIDTAALTWARLFVYILVIFITPVFKDTVLAYNIQGGSVTIAFAFANNAVKSLGDNQALRIGSVV